MTPTPLLLAGPSVALLPVPAALATALRAGNAVAVPVELAALGLRAADGWPRRGTPADATYLLRHGDQVVGDGRCGGPDAEGVVQVDVGLVGAAAVHTTEALAVLSAWTEQQPGVRLLATQVAPGDEATLAALTALGFVERGSHPRARRLVRPAPGVPLSRVRGRHVC